MLPRRAAVEKPTAEFKDGTHNRRRLDRRAGPGAHAGVGGNSRLATADPASSRRVWLALALAPLPVPVVVAAAALAVPGVPLTRVHAQTLTVRLYEAVGLGLAALLIAYAVAFCLWVVVYFGVVRICRPTRLRTCVLVGAAVGSIPPLVAASTILMWQMSAKDINAVALLYLMVMGAVGGAISGGVFQRVLRAISNRWDQVSR
jgi:hypothetical protein